MNSRYLLPTWRYVSRDRCSEQLFLPDVTFAVVDWALNTTYLLLSLTNRPIHPIRPVLCFRATEPGRSDWIGARRSEPFYELFFSFFSVLLFVVVVVCLFSSPKQIFYSGCRLINVVTFYVPLCYLPVLINALMFSFRWIFVQGFLFLVFLKENFCAAFFF